MHIHRVPCQGPQKQSGGANRQGFPRAFQRQTIGQRLGATNLLEGSVRKSGARVRITAQLVEAEGGSHIWSQEFDRELTDVFAVQDEIALSITGAIAPGIISAEIQQAQRKDASQLDAWDRTMRAHWHIRRFTQEDLAEHADIQRSYVAEVELGKRNPSLKHLQKLAKAFHVGIA